MSLLFAATFLRRPRMLGSIVPSSRFLVRELLEPLVWENAEVVVEYGPGVGTVTREILRRLPAKGCLIVIETDEGFVQHLRRHLVDPRLHVVWGSAADVERIVRDHGFSRVSCIISGIPFSTTPAELRRRILISSRAVLAPGGRFIAYQFSGRLLGELQRVFASVQRRFEPLNILPAHLFFCTPER